MSTGAVPFLRQETAWSCSVACLRMVLAHFGTRLDESTLRDCCHTTTAGTRAEDVVGCARRYGFDAYHVRGADINGLRRWLRSGAFPIILRICAVISDRITPTHPASRILLPSFPLPTAHPVPDRVALDGRRRRQMSPSAIPRGGRDSERPRPRGRVQVQRSRDGATRPRRALRGRRRTRPCLTADVPGSRASRPRDRGPASDRG